MRMSKWVNHTLYRGRLKQPKTEESRRAIRLVPIVVELLATHRGMASYTAQDDFIFLQKGWQTA
jgi:hypothetical protein